MGIPTYPPPPIPTTDPPPPLEGLRLWLTQGRELRSELLERQAVLQEEIEQIESALRVLDFKEEIEGNEPKRKRNVLDMTKGAVLRALRSAPEANTSRDIAAALGAKTMKRKHQIQVALRDLVAQKALKRSGSRGSYAYSIVNR